MPGWKTAHPGPLYMAALSAIRPHKVPFAAFYTHLREAGKPHKVAMTAVMRKLIGAINSTNTVA
jgi:transposase